MKILYTVNQLTPYHEARLKKLSQKLEKNNKRLEVIELFSSSNKYKFDKISFPLIIHKLNVKPLGNQDRFGLLKIKILIKKLLFINPSLIIISGWGGIQNIVQIVWGKLSNKKIIVLSDSKYDDYKRYKIIEFIKSLIIKNVDYFFVAGKVHKNYIEKLNINSNKIFLGCDVVDNDHFYKDRKNYTWNNKIVTIARLSKEKNLEQALNAFEIFSKKHITENWEWSIVGYGNLEEILMEKIRKKNLNVHLLGFRSYELIPAILFDHSIYWQPSIIEQWGLSINEAAANGMPLLLSNRCGATNELCDGSNGWIFDPFSEIEMARKLELVRNDKLNWKLMGINSQKKVAKFSLNNYVNCIEDIINRANK